MLWPFEHWSSFLPFIFNTFRIVCSMTHFDYVRKRRSSPCQKHCTRQSGYRENQKPQNMSQVTVDIVVRWFLALPLYNNSRRFWSESARFLFLFMFFSSSFESSMQHAVREHSTCSLTKSASNHWLTGSLKTSHFECHLSHSLCLSRSSFFSCCQFGFYRCMINHYAYLYAQQKFNALWIISTIICATSSFVRHFQLQQSYLSLHAIFV